MNGPGPTVADGMIYVNSGYAQWGGLPAMSCWPSSRSAIPDNAVSAIEREFPASKSGGSANLANPSVGRVSGTRTRDPTSVSLIGALCYSHGFQGFIHQDRTNAGLGTTPDLLFTSWKVSRARTVSKNQEAERMDHCVCRKLDSAILMVKAAKDRS